MTGADQTQLAVIEAPSTARLIVAAPPGAGKTWTAAQRLLRLVSADSADDDGTLLALAFSRAAALAMSAELHRQGFGSRVEVRTIDSWCTAMLAQQGLLPESFEYDDFDRRVEQLILDLCVGGLALPSYRHVIVDEAQDVLGARAQLIQALLDASTTAGWTVLGDPAQTIYAFAGEGATLFELATASGATALTLEGSYRAGDAALSEIVSLGQGLRVAPFSESAVNATFDAFRRLRLFQQSDLEVVAPNYAEGPDATVVLARTNREVLAIAEVLVAVGAQFQMLALRDAQLLPSWLAKLSAPNRSWLDESEILASLPVGIDDGSVLRSIRVLTAGGGKRLSVDALAAALRSRRCPEALMQPGRCPLSISTIHRAKGLEFDRVIVSAPLESRSEGDLVGDARLLYVALTRAKSKLIRLELSRKLTWEREARTGRMLDYRFAGPKRRIPAAVELRSGDIDFLQPCTDMEPRLAALKMVSGGAEVLLRRTTNDFSEVPVFDMMISGTAVVLGRTRLPFGEAVASLGWDRAGAMKGAQVMGRQTIVLPLGTLGNGVRLVEAPIIAGMVMPTEGESDGR